jgi:lipopolysaccharide transport system permease protein
VPDWGLLLLPVGLLLLGINAFAVSMLLGMVCARFRDVAQIVTSLMQIAFFMTPIIWKPDALKESAWIVLFNPFYVIMETVRAPLIEGGGSILVWVAAILATAAIAAISFAFFVRFRGRVAFWV